MQNYVICKNQLPKSPKFFILQNSVSKIPDVFCCLVVECYSTFFAEKFPFSCVYQIFCVPLHPQFATPKIYSYA